MVKTPVSKSLLQSLQDGGRCSDLKVLTLSTKKERLWMFTEPKMKKAETSKSGTNIMDLTNNGISSMLTNIQMSQRRENLTRSSDSMLKDHSTSFHNCHHTDTLISLAISLLSRLEMAETHKNGTSIKHHGQSDPRTTTIHGTFQAMVEAKKCKSQAPTPNGGNSSDMRVNTSSIGRMERLLMFQEEKISKDKQFGSGVSMEEPTRDGR